MSCGISRQIAVHCDEPNQIPVGEVLSILTSEGEIHINGEYHTLDDITDSIDVSVMRNAVQSLIEGNLTAIYDLYIKELEELI